MAALAVLTKEAIRFSNPSAEARVRDDLAAAVNGKLDLDFIDRHRAAWGFFRDRRTDLYGALVSPRPA
jgi:N-carbamoylputrescine amidase